MQLLVQVQIQIHELEVVAEVVVVLLLVQYDTAGKTFVLAVSALHHCLFSCAFDLVELHGSVAFGSWHFAGMCCRLPKVKEQSIVYSFLY
ncbi:hypothetical protein KCU83_g608, partial [Aureobasidium melanogenum]